MNRDDEDGVSAVLQGQLRRLLTGHAITCKVTEARKASIRLRDADEPSRSCTTIEDRSPSA